MELVKFDFDKHGAVFHEWLTHYKWGLVTKELLPPTGYMAVKDGLPICTGFMYKTDSVWSLFEWIIGNPNVTHEVRGEAFELLIEQIKKDTKAAGKPLLLTMSGNKRFLERCKNTGMQITDTGITHGLWTVI